MHTIITFRGAERARARDKCPPGLSGGHGHGQVRAGARTAVFAIIFARELIFFRSRALTCGKFYFHEGNGFCLNICPGKKVPSVTFLPEPARDALLAALITLNKL